MTGFLADSVANSLLDALFGDGANDLAPATYYLALSLTQPENDGTNVTEPDASGSAYARVAITNNSTNFPAAASRTKANGAAITFPEATATWGEITHWAMYSDATSTDPEDFRAWGELDTPVTIVAGGVLQFSSGDLDIDSPGA